VDENIRPARESDAAMLAWVLQESARSHLPLGVWDLAFPGPEEQRLAVLAKLATTKQLHYAHYSRFLVAEEDGKPAAALSAYEASEFGQEKLSLGVVEVVKDLGWSNEEIGGLIQRFEPYYLLGYPTPDGLWIIEWVATKPEFRGRGIIRKLLDAILEMGREEGYERSQVGYLLGNISAKTAYESVGFKWLDEYRHRAFEEAFGSPGFARMQRDL